ncbi:minor capsid protein [Bradyrhizobium oropedii]|uniref:phage head morphogenesis protein n=1 Tax=Bradyrhizobium oropedii TaxID=1571201 RepID=UPI001E41A7B7|nr:minor capsid protein [Bradyrhizobium oropedii]
MPTKKPNEKTLRPVHANAGIQARYRERLLAIIDEMNNSVRFWLKAAYRQNTPVMAQDRNPAEELRIAVEELAKRWQRNFDNLAPRLAEYFAQAVHLRSDAALRATLRKSGFTVKFKMTPAMRDVMDATITEQVSLIKSIPERYFTQVQGIVMRSVQTGRDLGQVTKDLQEQFGVTRRRAETIARDQNNKATTAMTNARQQSLGITEGDWVHSGAGKHPRPTHVAMNGKRFDLKKGMYDSAVGRWIMPGVEPNCRCFWRPVIKGFS